MSVVFVLHVLNKCNYFLITYSFILQKIFTTILLSFMLKFDSEIIVVNNSENYKIIRV